MLSQFVHLRCFIHDKPCVASRDRALIFAAQRGRAAGCCWQSGVRDETECSGWRVRVSGSPQGFVEKLLQHGIAAAEITGDRNQKTESTEKEGGEKFRTCEIRHDGFLLTAPVAPYQASRLSAGRARSQLSTFSAAMKASCGMSTLPNCRIFFLPSFCFSRSFRLRVTSPP